MMTKNKSSELKKYLVFRFVLFQTTYGFSPVCKKGAAPLKNNSSLNAKPISVNGRIYIRDEFDPSDTNYMSETGNLSALDGYLV